MFAKRGPTHNETTGKKNTMETALTSSPA